jgi:hypothetical protein
VVIIITKNSKNPKNKKKPSQNPQNLRYGETAYGTASKAVLKKLDPIHHIGVRLALGTFAVCKTENVLCGIINTNGNEGR